MKTNLGLADRVIRMLVAIAIGVLYYINVISGTLGIILLVVAGVFVITAFIGFCPLYYPFKIKTNKT